MSFILDALRKSDAERQRAATPGLADIRYSRKPPTRSVWLPLLAVALLANLGFMAVQWLRRAPAAPPPAAAVPAVPVETAPALPAVLPVAAPPADVRPLAGEAEPGDDPADALLALDGLNDGDDVAVAPVVAEVTAPAPLPAPPPATAVVPALPAEPAASAPSTPAASARVRDEPTLPTSAQLLAAGTLRVPELNLDLHVYNDAPERRFVVINGARYREGATLREGPAIEAITGEGVILDSQGTRFILRSR